MSAWNQCTDFHRTRNAHQSQISAHPLPLLQFYLILWLIWLCVQSPLRMHYSHLIHFTMFKSTEFPKPSTDIANRFLLGLIIAYSSTVWLKAIIIQHRGMCSSQHYYTLFSVSLWDNYGHISSKSCHSEALNPSFCAKSGYSIMVKMLIVVGQLVRCV